MEDRSKIEKATKNLRKKHRELLEALSKDSLSISQLENFQQEISFLSKRSLIKEENKNLSLTELGKNVQIYLQEKDSQELGILQSQSQRKAIRQQKIALGNEYLELYKQGFSYKEIGERYGVTIDEVNDILNFNSAFRKYIQTQKKEALLDSKLALSNEFLELYKQGFSYQKIGERYGMSRERVRQILESNPAFRGFKQERKKQQGEEKKAAEIERQEKEKAELYASSLAFLYPKQVTDLWDYEKNGELKSEQVLAGSASIYIWWKCPSCKHSWRKKPNDIKTSWERNGTSGCPRCAGKKGKSQKQPKLIEKYPELVQKYWDYSKNQELGIDPSKVTLGSNKKVWFKCPIDGNEWQAQISSTIIQQWSQGNTGCRVCNGTDERKQGRWQRGKPIAVEFPDEITKYWDYKKNNELKLDPTELTVGSSKRAWFKCPIDGHEWQTTVTAIAKGSWKKGNNGCPACRGFVTTEKTSLVALYHEYVNEYWDYEKNNQLGIYPDDLTRGSQKEAWFKCPIDDHEWKSRIGSITKSSWNQGNSGCPKCGQGWTLEAISQFVESLEEHIPNLTPAERYKIFEQAGVLGTQNKEGLKIVKDIIKGKLSGNKLRNVLEGKGVITQDYEVDLNQSLEAENEMQLADSLPVSTALDINGKPEFCNDSSEEIDTSESAIQLSKAKVQKSLEFLNSKVVASTDREAIEFFIASRLNRIWTEVFKDESAVEALENFTDEGYGRDVRDQFLDEYNQASNMVVPAGWGFRVNGKITPPNLMQKLAAVRLRNQKRMLNLSLTGTGKTISGILSSRVIDAHLTIIICPIDTITNWHSEIKHVFPSSKVTFKNFNPCWIDVETGHHYIILNHEMFQQNSTSNNISQLLKRYKVDLIIIDEIHKCKQRGNDVSKRRQMVMALITNAAKKNSNLHVLGMSATPVINNLKEGKSLIELVTGLERSDLGEKASINNCMNLHQAFVTLGIRSKVKPKIKIERVKIPIDCTYLVNTIREYGTSILKMEQILTNARIPTIIKEIKPKTIVYTHYVEGITNQLQEAIEAQGWTVGFHIGGDKSGRDGFINGSIDVLIASSAMVVGVDGFQRVCDRLILNIPPWTSAELEQLEGRLNRQGQIHNTISIIMPATYGFDDGEPWSWDEERFARLQNKQTIADAAVDGVMPDGQLRSESQAFRDLRKWLERLKTGERKSLSKPTIFVPLPDIDPVDIQRRNANYGDFNRMNARWNSSYSHTTYQRLQDNPEEWMQYHTLYQEARKSWDIIPYQEAIKWLQMRSELVVADFGCGEAFLAKFVKDIHTVHSFDFIAINDSVIECDMAHVPLEDSCLDIAMFNLSLMGINISQYIAEAARTLKLDGQLWIYEAASRFNNPQEFLHLLELAGFRIIDNFEISKFCHIRAIKSYEVNLKQFQISI